MILNEEQRILQDSIRAFVRENAPVEQLRQLRDSHDPLGYDATLWSQLVELGLSCAVLPEAYGGLDIGWLGMGAVMEACGTNLVASPLLATTVLGTSLLEHGAHSSQRDRWLSEVAAGERTLAVAIDETHRFSPLQTAMTLCSAGDNWLLTGHKCFVLDGHSADLLLVVVRADGGAGDRHGLTVLAIEPDRPGVQVQRVTLMDGRNAANIQFNEVSIGASDIVGQPGEAWPALAIAIDRATACLAAEMLGGATEVFNRTLTYLKEREQFDVKIGSFQALQHRAAQMFCQLEQCRSAVLNALQSLDHYTDDTPRQVSLAKALANDCYQHLTNEAVQMHGGMGVTDELDIGLYLKRARVSIQTFGDTRYHRDRFATCMGF